MKVNKFLTAVAVSRFLSTVTIASYGLVLLSSDCSGDEISEDSLKKGLIKKGLPEADAEEAARLLKDNGIDTEEKMEGAVKDALDTSKRINSLLKSDNELNELAVEIKKEREKNDEDRDSKKISSLEDRFKNMIEDKTGVSYKIIEKKTILFSFRSLEDIKNIIAMKKAKI